MNIFYNSAGEFQWVLITAVISLFGIITTLLSTVYINKKSRRASMKSTTKIEWINKIIQLSAEYINNYQLIGVDAKHTILCKIQKNETTFTIEEDIITYDHSEALIYQENQNKRHMYDKKINEHSEEFNERVRRINYIANQLLLYFMDSSESQKSRTLIGNLRKQLVEIANIMNKSIEQKEKENGYEELVRELNNSIDKLESLTEEFQKHMSNYLSSELRKVEKNI